MWAAVRRRWLERTAVARRGGLGRKTARLLLFQADVHELRRAERVDLEARDVLADGLIHRGMGDWRERHLVFEDFLGFRISFGALGKIGRAATLPDQIVVRLVAPFGKITAVHCVAAEQYAQPVIRVAIVAGPADQHCLMLA